MDHFIFSLEDLTDAALELLLPGADLRRGNVVIFGDLLNRLLVLHRLSGDEGFELGTQGPSFSFAHFWSYFRGVAPLDELNSSINLWLRFLEPLQFYLAQCAVIIINEFSLTTE